MSKATESVQKARISNYESVLGVIKQQIAECNPIYVNSIKHLKRQQKRYRAELKQVKELGKL